jgi:sulfur-oxidizing protein SoxY
VTEAIKSVFGNKSIHNGRITLKLPKIAETGNSVPLTLSVKSPMSAHDRVLRACIFANRNPRPLIATMTFGPGAGRASFSTNIRLSGTQDVIGIAEMSDRSLWRTQMRVVVTVGACDALQTRY